MDIKALVSQMTLEEKAGMCSGTDFWHTQEVKRLGIPAVMVADGPFGLRKQDEEGDHLGVNDSIKAVCFPASCATAASFDRELLIELGTALGNECQAEGVSTILGPAVNIKRSPLCGRNFEYYSEDPYLTTEIAKSHVMGVQSQNVGTSMKHFLANNQEYRRLSTSSEVDERTLREIYLAAFEGAVKEAKPWTVMCSYNKLNGKYVIESKRYLTDILRGEWGFDGYVMSDWGAVNDIVKDVEAGLDLEMPSSYGQRKQELIEAVENGKLDEEVINQAAERILNIVFRFEENRNKDAKWDLEADHELARKIESECAVLLKNDGILPLKREGKVAFIGKYAEKPRYQGGGSSHINSFKMESALDAVKQLGITDTVEIAYAMGYDDKIDVVDEKMTEEAVKLAEAADTVVIFAGLPDSFESEGYDRKHMKMPNCQIHLIEEIAKVNKNIVVLLHNGSPIEMPWLPHARAVLEMYLGGQAVGGAEAELLFGLKNPCGKLAESFPVRLEDNPSYIFFGGENGKTEYREGIFVGYRYYDKKKMEVLFPFGHGLSYTSFAYSNLKLSKDAIKDTEEVKVSVDITNTGDLAGKEIVQLYVGKECSNIIRPVRELRGFEKVYLNPGETKTVEFKLGKRAFAYFDTQINDWMVENGEYNIDIAKSSRQIELSAPIKLQSTVTLRKIYTMDDTLGDLVKDEAAMKIMKPLVDAYMFGGEKEGEEQSAASEAITKEMEQAMFDQTPLRSIVPFGNGKITFKEIEELLLKVNTRIK